MTVKQHDARYAVQVPRYLMAFKILGLSSEQQLSKLLDERGIDGLMDALKQAKKTVILQLNLKVFKNFIFNLINSVLI